MNRNVESIDIFTVPSVLFPAGAGMNRHIESIEHR